MGDFEVTDPQAMRALAHPVRLAVLSHLQRHGPSTATRLAAHVDASPSVTSWHLRHLSTFGLVADSPDPEGGTDKRQRWWRAVARGIRLEMPASPEGRAAARLLRMQMMAQALAHPQRWLAEVEPELDEDWSRLAGSGSTGLRLTPAEARKLEEAIEALLVPYVRRIDEAVPAEAREVRVVRFFLPEPPARPRA